MFRKSLLLISFVVVALVLAVLIIWPNKSPVAPLVQEAAGQINEYSYCNVSVKTPPDLEGLLFVLPPNNQIYLRIEVPGPPYKEEDVHELVTPGGQWDS